MCVSYVTHFVHKTNDLYCGSCVRVCGWGSVNVYVCVRAYLQIHLLWLPVGSEAAGGVHVLQRTCRRKGHHAAHSNGGASKHAAGSRRGGQNGVPEGQD